MYRIDYDPALPEGDDGDTIGAGKPKISGKEPPKIKYKPLDASLKEHMASFGKVEAPTA